MKKTLLVLIFMCLALIAVSLKAQSGWQQLNTGMVEGFNAVFITPTGRVYIGTEQGNIYRSDNGGTSLNATNTGVTDGIADIFFLTPAVGMAVGDDGMVLSTSDSGSTWTSVSSGVSANLESIFFVDADTAYIAGRDGVILKSTNGGTSWSSLNSGSLERLESVYFPTAQRGFVAGRNGVLLETNNYGASWSNVNLGSDDNHSVFFTHQDTGFVGGENGIFKTVDGGNTWTAVTVLGGMKPNELHFGSSSHGYAVGEMGEMARSIDGGDNWAPDTNITIAELNDVYFLDAQNGLAVGDGGTLLRRIGSGSSNNFCQASFWADTVNSGSGNLYVVNNSVPSSSAAGFTVSYSWDFGDGGTSAQALPSHTYASFGAYQVCLTVTVTDASNNTCTDTYCDTLGLDSLGNVLHKASMAGFTLNVIDSSSIGISEAREDQRVEVFPNPASDELRISYPREWQSVKLQIFSLTGQEMLMQKIQAEDQLDISALPKGTYLMRLSDRDRPLVSRLFIRN